MRTVPTGATPWPRAGQTTVAARALAEGAGPGCRRAPPTVVAQAARSRLPAVRRGPQEGLIGGLPRALTPATALVAHAMPRALPLQDRLMTLTQAEHPILGTPPPAPWLHPSPRLDPRHWPLPRPQARGAGPRDSAGAHLGTTGYRSPWNLCVCACARKCCCASPDNPAPPWRLVGVCVAGRPFFQLHPCNTAAAMAGVTTPDAPHHGGVGGEGEGGSYVKTWISMVGTAIGLSLAPSHYLPQTAAPRQ